MIYSCCDENRRAAILNNPTLNGDRLPGDCWTDPTLRHAAQQTLLVALPEAGAYQSDPGQILITGGESITGITALWVGPAGQSRSPAIGGA